MCRGQKPESSFRKGAGLLFPSNEMPCYFFDYVHDVLAGFEVIAQEELKILPCLGREDDVSFYGHSGIQQETLQRSLLPYLAEGQEPPCHPEAGGCCLDIL